ncbi:helix-turn-helix domain-containing protein [Paenibacillus sp. MY03]|uniref:helix-turn-helix domain-containing protein n=1 Tax=Paenibacillus sp. MY03 TaxID=302980 RepID=UPI0015C6957F|nr:helix-turn-helix transcriptional regulator [Paenibacillus sp. MY03]
MFSERLRQLRSKTGLSQTEIARRLGIARTTYSGYENGSREPDLKTLNKLSEHFDVDLNWLIAGESKVSKDLYEDVELVEMYVTLKESDQKYILELMERFKKDK